MHNLLTRLSIVIAYLLLLAACASGNEAAPIDAPYNKVFDPWRACIAAEDSAKKGAPDSLRTLFLAAYVRLSQPFLGGEDLEHMSVIFSEVYSNVGDSRFSEILATQRPEVQSAARRFLVDAPKSSKTALIFQAAPEIDWPLDQGYRADL